MNIDYILQEYDSLFGKTTLAEIEAYLYEKIREAIEEQDDSAILTFLNEMIGLCRDTSQKEKALVYCEQLKKLMVRMNLEGTRDYATSMQNIANAYRAFGQWEAAEEAFQSIEKTYKTCLNIHYEEICYSEKCRKNLTWLDLDISNVPFTKDAYLWASLYNNWGLLYQEKQEYTKSVETLQKALAVIMQLSNGAIKQAITKTNLANSLLGLQTEEAIEKGYSYITEALKVFVEDGEKDFHYGAALVAM